MEETMLKITNLHKTFDPGTINAKTALDGIDLHLKDGDFVTVIGGNGAGKSTLLNAIAGVWKPDFGTIEIDGVDVTLMPEYRRAKYLGRVFQDPMKGTAPDMEIAENLFIASRRGTKRRFVWGVRKKDRVLYKELLATLDLGLEDRISHKVGLLSGGQRQAVTLLMATLNRPKLLLLDEHTASLDPKTAVKVLELTDQIVHKNKLTTLMITHNMKEAIAHGNRLIMMHEGKIIVDISGDEKKNLTVEQLLNLFMQASDGDISDRMVLN
jgi:putative ABC transport system ATP-binding protein